jgi:predicted HAD superfamily Cof-like phosphohydrolase
MNLEQLVKEFHRKFGLEYTGQVRALPPEYQQFRTARMQEELDEYKQAVEEEDLEKQFDALIDLVYIALGNAHLHGFPFNKGFELVHTANMSKQRAEKPTESRYGTTYDIIKPTGWTPPNLKVLLSK